MNNYFMGMVINTVMAALMAAMSLWILKEYFQIFFEKSVNRIYYYALWSIYFIWQISAIMQLIDLPVYLKISVNVFLIFFISLLYEGNVSGKIIFTILYNSLWMMMEFLVGYIFIILGVYEHSLELLGSLLSKILLLILVKALQKFFGNDSVQGIAKKYIIAFMLILNGSMYVVYDSFMMRSNLSGHKNIFNSFLSLLIMFTINILMFNLYLRLSENLELKRKNLVFEQSINLYDMYIKEKENSVREFRRTKHDLKNRLIYLKKLLEEEKYDELDTFLDNIIMDKPFQNLLIANTNNSVIDALVNYKYALAKNNDIEFITKLDVPTSLPFDSSDLCVILGNALDNAIEANIRLKSSHRYIKLLMRIDFRNLIILIENSFDGNIRKNKQGKILTLKDDMENHGIGIDSIRKAAEKYHGYVTTECDNNIFRLKIVLYS